MKENLDSSLAHGGSIWVECKIIFSQAYYLQKHRRISLLGLISIEGKERSMCQRVVLQHEILLNYHSISPHSVFTLITQVCVFMWEKGRQTNRDRRQRHRDKETILDLYPSEFWEILLNFEREAFTDPTQPQCLTPDPSHNSCVSELRSDGLVPLGTIGLVWKLKWPKVPLHSAPNLRATGTHWRWSYLSHAQKTAWYLRHREQEELAGKGM